MKHPFRAQHDFLDFWRDDYWQLPNSFLTVAFLIGFLHYLVLKCWIKASGLTKKHTKEDYYLSQAEIKGNYFKSLPLFN